MRPVVQGSFVVYNVMQLHTFGNILCDILWGVLTLFRYLFMHIREGVYICPFLVSQESNFYQIRR
jgi:hypothetical protein